RGRSRLRGRWIVWVARRSPGGLGKEWRRSNPPSWRRIWRIGFSSPAPGAVALEEAGKVGGVDRGVEVAVGVGVLVGELAEEAAKIRDIDHRGGGGEIAVGVAVGATDPLGDAVMRAAADFRGRGDEKGR